MQEYVSDPTSYGIYVINRRSVSPEASVQQLTQVSIVRSLVVMVFVLWSLYYLNLYLLFTAL